MKRLCGIFDFKKNQYYDDSKEIKKYEDENYEIYLFGNAEINKRAINGKSLWECYQKSIDELTRHVRGIYILLVYNKKSNRIDIFFDRTTSSLTLYYTVNNNKVYIATSLKWLLLKSSIKRSINENVLEEFFVNGFIYGKETLVKNVYKMNAFTRIQIHNYNIEEYAVTYPIEEMSKGEALSKWEKYLSQAINRCFKDKSEINITLSSGYDSNYIAYLASKNQTKKINAYSIGGKYGKNELPLVEENVTAYKNIRLTETVTDENTLLNFPDIVWRLEGAVFEVGIFLQYELAKLVSNSGKKSLICGECADQVMNQYYLAEDRIFPAHDKTIYYEFSEYPYIFGSYLILKKNGLLANSFGVDTEYPYLDEEFVSIAHTLRNISKKDKRVHVSTCEEVLPDIVLKNISKIGGATDFHSLIINDNERKDLVTRVINSEFYEKYSSIIKNVSYIEKEKQVGLKRIKTIIRNLILDLFHIDTDKRNQTKYFFEEVEMKEYISCAYLILFKKLFLSGLYDDKFDCDGIDLKLYDLLTSKGTV